MCENTYANADRHDDKADTEDRINLTNDLIDRYECCDKVVDQYNCQPEIRVGQKAGTAVLTDQHGDQGSRSYRKYGTYHDKQDNTEYTHNLFHKVSKIHTGQLGEQKFHHDAC